MWIYKGITLQTMGKAPSKESSLPVWQTAWLHQREDIENNRLWGQRDHSGSDDLSNNFGFYLKWNRKPK